MYRKEVRKLHVPFMNDYAMPSIKDTSSLYYVLDCIDKGLYQHIASTKVNSARKEINTILRNGKRKHMDPPRWDTLHEVLKHIENGDWINFQTLWRANMKLVMSEYQQLMEYKKLLDATLMYKKKNKDPKERIHLHDDPHRSVDSLLDERRRFENSDRSYYSLPNSLNSSPQYDIRSSLVHGHRLNREEMNEKTSNEDIIQMQQHEIETLTHRLNQLGGKKFKAYKPQAVDLNDPNRPTKLADHFSELYEREWKEAYNELSDIKTIYSSEKDVIGRLLAVVQRAQSFCRATAESQLLELTVAVRRAMVQPATSGFKPVKTKHALETDKLADFILRDVVPNIKQVQKLSATVSVPRLKMAFLDQVMDELFTILRRLRAEGLTRYIHKCLEVVWLMTVQDPPMHLEYCFPGETSFDNFRPHKKPGTFVSFCVWPAVHLHETGPLIKRGIACLG